jgi:hypothetical protein
MRGGSFMSIKDPAGFSIAAACLAAGLMRGSVRRH